MKNIKKISLILLCLPLVLTGCKKVPTLQDGKQVIVELNGKQFTAEEFFDALKESGGTSILVNMVDKYITEQELTEERVKELEKQAKTEFDSYKTRYSSNWSNFLSYYGYNTDDEFLTSLKNSAKQRDVLKNYVKNDVIKDEDIQKYYDEEVFGENTVRHILIKSKATSSSTDDEKKKAEEEALNKTKEIIEQLKNSEKLEEDFTNLAKEKSEDTGSASTGGLIENFTNDSGLVKEFWEASLKLEVGKMTLEPVKTEFGYHIIYKVSQKEKPSLDSVRDTVINKVIDKLLSAENANYIYWAGLREKYGMQIHDDIIKNSYDLTMKNLNKKAN